MTTLAGVCGPQEEIAPVESHPMSVSYKEQAWREIIINTRRSSCAVSVTWSGVTKVGICWHISIEAPNTKYHENPPRKSVFSCGRTDMQLVVAFRSFAIAP